MDNFKSNRYGVLGPGSSSFPIMIKHASCHAAVNEDSMEQNDDQRHALVDSEPGPYESACLVKWMTKNLPIICSDKSDVSRQKSGMLPMMDGISHNDEDDFEDDFEEMDEDEFRASMAPIQAFEQA